MKCYKSRRLIPFMLMGLALLFVAGGCSRNTREAIRDMERSDRSPCNDKVYLALKARHLDSLSVREFALFQSKDRACADFKMQMADKQRTEAQATDVTETIVLLSILGVAVSVILYLIATNESY